MAWAKRKVAHLPLHAARVPAVAARYDAFFEEFVQYLLMKRFPMLRGE